MNHRWKDNVCQKCGLVRDRMEYKKAGLPYSVLGRDGCWYDKVPFTYGTAWYYGIKSGENSVMGIGFERPPCPIELPKVQVSDTTEDASSNADDNQK